MKLWMVGVEGVKIAYQDWLHFYGRNEKACFGPVRLFLGKLYISKFHYDIREATTRCEQLKPHFDKCNIKPYGRLQEGILRRWVIWVYSSDTDNDPNLLEGYKGAFDPVSFSERVYNRLPQPDHQIHTSKAFQAILEEQSALNEELGSLRDDLILPMQCHGMSLEDSLRWLHMKKKDRRDLGKGISKDAKIRKESFLAVPDDLFFRDTDPSVKSITEQANRLELRVKELHSQNFVQNYLLQTNSENPYHVTIHLRTWKNTGKGYARLFD